MVARMRSFAAVARLRAGDGREGVLEGARDVPVREGGDHGRNPHRARAERLSLEAVDGELLEARRRELGLARGELHDLGTSRLCTVAGLSESCSLSRIARSWATCWSTTHKDSGSSTRM
jgi:hypothetical protein